MSVGRESAAPDYTVRLEQLFEGPMDLLLHLVREQEVDVHEIEINKVIDGYLAYLGDLERFDIELAGDFVLMAATLMSIKARSLLPHEEVDLEAELDPRDELIQRLIEYRRFKDASRDLEERRVERARLHARGASLVEAAEPALDLSDLSVWDLLSTWTRLLRETLADHRLHITSDERPLRFYVEQLVGELKARREIRLGELVEHIAEHEGAARTQLVGTFCALLELMKLGVARAWQPERKGEIIIVLREDLDGDVDDLVRACGFEDEQAPPGPPAAPPAPA